MIFKHLDWDSNFFSKRIGRIDLTPADSEQDLENEIRSHQEYDLLYIFSDNQLLLPHKDFRCKLADQKVTFIGNLTSNEPKKPENTNIIITESNHESTPKELELLAYQSGEFSRFKTDTRFDPNDFYRLYKKWIDNSVSKEIADNIYIAFWKEIIAGFVTVQHTQDYSKIDLIAVDQDFQGHKIGSSLMDHIIYMSWQKGIKKIYVDTQAANIKACGFYLHKGFSKHKIVNIYHYWLNNSSNQ